jgi:phytoene synthase
MSAALADSAAYRQEARAVIQRHSKSFSLAALLLGPHLRDDASALYAYCRRADDAVDLVSPSEAPAKVRALERELDAVYSGQALREPVLVAFQRLVFDKRIPRVYPAALLEGFELDASGERYETLPELLHYCWCVAGSVGAMMCHVLGVRRERAVVHGAHLGMAMQLTNVCRDVAEDWGRGRLYLPTEMAKSPAMLRLSEPLTDASASAAALVVRRLLREADSLYASGDAGLRYLSPRARWGVATARRVYAAIGARISTQGADVRAGRAIVPTAEKFWHAGLAALTCSRLAVTAPKFHAIELRSVIRFPEDVLPY